MLAALLAAAISLTAPDPQLSALVGSDAAGKIETVAVMMITAGSCSKWLTPEQNKMFQSFADFERHKGWTPEQTEVGDMLSKVFTDLYLEGIATKNPKGLTPEICSKLLSRDIQTINGW